MIEQNPIFENLQRAWCIASKELSFVAHVPYQIHYNDDVIVCIAYLPHFGGPCGTLAGVGGLGENNTSSLLQDYCKEKGIYFSYINSLYYEYYNEEKYKEMLVDWGYFGPEEMKPLWLQGI